MRINPILRMLFGFLVFICRPLVFSSPMLVAQQPPHCAQILFCLFNQEATASDSTGIHKYSQDLIGLILPNPEGNDSVRQLTSQLADRLARAEQAERTGDGKLVPEAAVAKAFNDLMQGIGAPPSMKASEASVHAFREHAASIKAFPVLFTSGRNGANCNPGEAVFLLGLLLSDNGVLYEGNLDAAVAMIKWDAQQGGPGYAVARIESMNSSSSGLLLWYSLHHDPNANTALLNHAADTLGL